MYPSKFKGIFLLAIFQKDDQFEITCIHVSGTIHFSECMGTSYTHGISRVTMGTSYTHGVLSVAMGTSYTHGVSRVTMGTSYTHGVLILMGTCYIPRMCCIDMHPKI